MNAQRLAAVTAVLLVSVILLAPFTFIGGASGKIFAVTNFANGGREAIITFTQGGDDSSAKLSLPRGCTVQQGPFSITGSIHVSPVSSVHEFTFNDSIDNQAWWGESSNNISQTNTDPRSWQEYGYTDLLSLTEMDGSYLNAPYQMGGQGPGGGGQNQQGQGNGGAGQGQGAGHGQGAWNSYEYQQFMFKVDVTDLSALSVEWNGNAYSQDWNTGSINYGAQFLVWNNATQGWEELGHYDNETDSTDHWIQASLSTGLANYIYNDNEVHVIASNWAGIDSGYSVVNTNFIKATITGKDYSYPTDVKVDIGDDGSTDWSHNGPLKTTQAYTEEDLMYLLQKKINVAGPGYENLEIPIRISSSTQGIVSLNNLSITVGSYVNKAPFAFDIPSTYHFPEGTNAPDLIDLTDYFTDDLDPSTSLTYALVSESDPAYLHSTVTSGGMMGFTSAMRYWSGSTTFQVSAKDSAGLETLSMPFSVKVDAVPDPPVLESLGDLVFTQGVSSVVFIHATDPDNLFDGQDPLTYSSDFIAGRTLFTIGAMNGFAIFTPTEADLGDHTVDFTVTDSTGLKDSETVQLKVLSSPLVLARVGNLTLETGNPFTLQLRALGGNKDGLTFSVKFCSGGEMFTMGPDGFISFTPSKDTVGNHDLLFTASDSAGDSFSEPVTFQVVNVNSAPILADIPKMVVVVNAPVQFNVTASDEDLGYGTEYLTFTDDTDLFTIDPDSGAIDFVATQVGMFNITIVVDDIYGASDFRYFILQVLPEDIVDQVTVVVKGGSTDVKEGDTVTLTAQGPDTDQLTYTWTENGKELGSGKELRLKGLKPGEHTITLVVSDGTKKVTRTVTIKVNKPKNFGLPGFDAATTLMALGLVCLASIVMARRKY